MAGTSEGGKRAAATNKSKHGADFYKRIGSVGGQKGRTGGFFANRELASKAGRKGGRASRRPSPELQLLERIEIGGMVAFSEEPQVIRNRYHNPAKRNGLRVSIYRSGDLTILERVE